MYQTLVDTTYLEPSMLSRSETPLRLYNIGNDSDFKVRSSTSKDAQPGSDKTRSWSSVVRGTTKVSPVSPNRSISNRSTNANIPARKGIPSSFQQPPRQNGYQPVNSRVKELSSSDENRRRDGASSTSIRNKKNDPFLKPPTHNTIRPSASSTSLRSNRSKSGNDHSSGSEQMPRIYLDVHGKSYRPAMWTGADAYPNQLSKTKTNRPNTDILAVSSRDAISSPTSKTHSSKKNAISSEVHVRSPLPYTYAELAALPPHQIDGHAVSNPTDGTNQIPSSRHSREYLGISTKSSSGSSSNEERRRSRSAHIGGSKSSDERHQGTTTAPPQSIHNNKNTADGSGQSTEVSYSSSLTLQVSGATKEEDLTPPPQVSSATNEEDLAPPPPPTPLTPRLRNLHANTDAFWAPTALAYVMNDPQLFNRRLKTTQGDSDATPHGTPMKRINALLPSASAAKDTSDEFLSPSLSPTSLQSPRINIIAPITADSAEPEIGKVVKPQPTVSQKHVLSTDVPPLVESKKIEVTPLPKAPNERKKPIRRGTVTFSEEAVKKSIEEESKPLGVQKQPKAQVALVIREEPISPSLSALMENNKLISLTGTVVFDRNKPVAHGGFATVYKGRWGTKPVAVKELRINKNYKIPNWEKTMRRRSKREMEIWAALKHPNIVPLFGYTMDEHNPFPAMISEWCENGSASEYLGDLLRGASKSRRERIRLGREVADGLSYMHSLKLVHGDIKPSNVLISAEGIARLCDFGLVRVTECQVTPGMTTTTPYGGTIRYKAPELFNRRTNNDRNSKSNKAQSPKPTFSSDVYALGCVIYEFVSSNLPYHDCDDIALIAEAIRDGESPAERPTDVKGEEAKLWDLLQESWNSNPKKRPAIENAAKRLRMLSVYL